MDTQAKKIPNILFIARDNGGCGFYRMQQPANFIKRMGLAHTEVVLQKPTPEQLLDADLVIFQHLGTSDAANLANFCSAHFIPYVAEFDDFIHHISPNNAGGYVSWNPGTLLVHRAMETARGAIALTVSTPQLAREYFPYNPNIYVVPNYLDKDNWENPLVKKQDGKIRIGWCGGNAHADDLKMISKVLDKIVKEYKGKVIFETMGMTRHELAGVFPMQATSETCPSCGYEGELHHWPGESQQDYPLVLASRGWDIAVAPVIDNSFGNCKSDLKLKEYAAIGLPFVASPVVAYREAAASNAQVAFASTFEEWYNTLKELIESPERRDQIVRSNKEWIAKNWIQDNAQKTFEIYAEIIQKAEALFGRKEDRLKRLNML